MGSFWSGACKSATGRPFTSLIAAIYGSSSVTVRDAHAAPLPLFARLVARAKFALVLLMPRSQLAAFCLSAVASAYMFARWRRLDEDDREKVWRLYGRYTGLMFVGSCFGAAAWLCNMQTFAFNFTAHNLRITTNQSAAQVQIQTTYAQQSAWQAAFFVFYSLDFLFLSSALLLILDRMLGFIENFTASINICHQPVAAGRIVMTTVVVGNVVGLCGNVAASAYSARASALNLEAAAAWTADPSIFPKLVIEYGIQYRNVARAQSVQQFSEVVVLLVIIVAFAASGAISIKRMRAVKNTGSAGARLQLKVMTTVGVVFLSFLLRAIFSIMLAVSGALQNYDVECTGGLCAPCYNMYSNMQVWLHFTPEFQLIIMLISSPLASLVALWGMTSDRMWKMLTSRGGENRDMKPLQVLDKKSNPTRAIANH